MSIQKNLFRKFIPLSLSDATMMLGDPLQTITLSHLAGSETQLAAIGITKAFAVFLESPIIMILHASTALSGNLASRRALFRFVLILSGVLTAIFATVALVPSIYDGLLSKGFGATSEITEAARLPFILLIIWPAAIALRRFFQGMLIRRGKNRWVANASLFRLLWVSGSLLLGYVLIQERGWTLSGAVLASVAMGGGVLVEAVLAMASAKKLEADSAPLTDAPNGTSKAQPAPETVSDVGRFYFPLATTMLLVWGARAILVGIVARSFDGPLALAAWPAAWGFVLVISNSTRMIQQLVIASPDVPAREFFKFALSVGAGASLLIAGLAFTPMGQNSLSILLGAKNDLLLPCLEVLKIASVFPLLVCFQNVFQGFLIRHAGSYRVNLATLASIALSLAFALALVNAGYPGARAAAIGMVLGVFAEVLLLRFLSGSYISSSSSRTA